MEGPGMEGPGRAAGPSGGPDHGESEPRWPQPPEEGTDRPAEPRCETPLAGPQSLPALPARRPESAQPNEHHEAQENAEPTRQSCGDLQRPFPLPEGVPLSQEQEKRLCCEHCRELCDLRAETRTPEDANSLPRALSTDESVGSESNLLLSKEDWRQQKRPVSTELSDQSLELSVTREGTPEPAVGAEPEPESCPEESEPELWPEEEPELEPQPKEEPELEPQPKEKPGMEPQPKEEPELEPQPEEKPEMEPQPEEKPEPEPRPRKEHRRKKERRPKKEPRPKSQPEEDPMSRSTLSYDFSLLGKKVGKAKLVQKYYKNGKKFLTMLPDGSSQLFYPSGNLAIIITGERDHHSLIVQEDELKTTRIRALFQSDGRSTCYYRNGDEWINMSIQGGQYLDQAGNRVRRWMWPNLSPEPHVPLSPIFISLNRHVGVRILAQDKIFVSFLAMGRQAKFNMGTRVQVSASSQLPPAAQLGEDELLLLAFRVRILQLFDRMRGCLNFPSGEQWNKMQPPMYLITQAVKILELCMAADISDELRSSIKAIVNAQQL
ncbi:hypothetical protein HGM15179_019369 [Zosterops borbonicus]|uniref:FAM194 C-terminal domain-containing protein n=1 Tax=Zosterops borbonicus TaxID=364589 RepID=A0A8K1D9V8_9PASS|nr:hypothetical protein HGM15179_019369 [Zosterops borbonicus]